ncbi:MAG: RNA methyltransferase [Prevotella sp.]|nr:RNA methyltransferase [Staphylococcus sp.]MCM1350992.1 RNA methyltransferase [Prevotella sp.]
MAENRIQIQSINNEKIKYLQSLKDKKTRNHEKKFLVEGFHLVEEAAKTPDLQMVVTTDTSYIQSISFSHQVQILIVTTAIIEKLSTTIHPQQILGVVKMPSHGPKQLEKLLQAKEVKLILLDEINDPGNLGTIIRTTSAFGYDGIVMSPNTVDLYNEKVIRATQGTLFKIPIVKMNLQEAIGLFKKYQVKCYGACLQQAKSLQEIQISKKMAICFGNEARGISKPILDAMDERVKIEMKNHVESLNVAIASAIIMYEWMDKE